jgi:hypothetical protein
MNRLKVARARPRPRIIAIGAAAVVVAGIGIFGITSAFAATSGAITGFGGKCVDVAAASSANGTQIQLYTCNGTGAQQWTVADDGSIQALGKCMDVSAAGTANGTKIQLYDCNGTGAQKWTASNGELINPASGKCLDATGPSSADGTPLQIWACAGSANQLWTLPGGSTTPTTPPVSPTGPTGTTPDFGPNVTIFDPSTPASTIQSKVNSVYGTQQTNQFGSQRFALLFKPGTYNVDVPVGYYTQIAGLGQNPDQVNITGGSVHVDAKWQGGNATQNFWRSAENMELSPSSGRVMWAVSQADPFQRIDVRGTMILDDDSEGSSSNWSSGGYIGNSRVSGLITSGTQQQFLTQDTNMNGGWNGANWNMVFVGDTGAPAGNSFPNPPDTTVAQSPTIREKPYLYVDSANNYSVFVPSLRTNAQGPDWTNGNAPGTSLPISQFYIVKPGDTAATMNAALAGGKNLLVTPGVYHLSQALNVTRANTVILGLGLATLVPDNGATAINTADVDGVDLAGLLISAGTTNSASLVQIGPAGSSASHASNPTVLQDVFFRVGGDVAGKATQSLVINSANTIAQDLWVWRADHGSGVGWNTNTAQNGVVVNGANVTIYGLAVEHYQQYNVIWNGNGGRTYFFQNEMPYDVPNQSAYMNGGTQGWAAYKVGASVTTHEAWGVGSYCFFNVNPSVVNAHAFEVPVTSGVRFHGLMTFSLGGDGTITHIINNSGGPSNSSHNLADLASGP